MHEQWKVCWQGKRAHGSFIASQESGSKQIGQSSAGGVFKTSSLTTGRFWRGFVSSSHFEILSYTRLHNPPIKNVMVHRNQIEHRRLQKRSSRCS
jgi:hypothetical protein